MSRPGLSTTRATSGSATTSSRGPLKSGSPSALQDTAQHSTAQQALQAYTDLAQLHNLMGPLQARVVVCHAATGPLQARVVTCHANDSSWQQAQQQMGGVVAQRAWGHEATPATPGIADETRVGKPMRCNHGPVPCDIAVQHNGARYTVRPPLSRDYLP